MWQTKASLWIIVGGIIGGVLLVITGVHFFGGTATSSFNLDSSSWKLSVPYNSWGYSTPYGNEISFLINPDTYIQERSDKASAVTYGSGIRSGFTVRKGVSPKYEKERLATYASSEGVEKYGKLSRVTKINIGGNTWKHYETSGWRGDDYGQAGVSEWQTIHNNTVYVFSFVNESGKNDDEIAVIWSVQFPGDKEREETLPIASSVEDADVARATVAGSLTEGSHDIVVQRDSKILLPSGSVVAVTPFQKVFIFDAEEKASGNNTAELISDHKMYHKGYIYNFRNIRCTSERVEHDDYGNLELKECSMHANVTKGEPSIVKYDNYTKDFSSVSERDENHDPAAPDISYVLNSVPYVAVGPPYIQLYKDSGTKKYEHTSPLEDTVRVYTHYGFTDFKFEHLVDELFSKVSKTQKIGPLTITLTVAGLGCFRPYLQKNNKCNDPGKDPVYNKVNFRLNITEDPSIPREVKVFLR